MSVGASKKSATTFSLLGELAMKLGELVRSDTAVPPMPVKTSRRIPLVWAGSRCVAVTRHNARKIKCLIYDLAYYIADLAFGKFSGLGAATTNEHKWTRMRLLSTGPAHAG